jgi:uncharacterized membrane protein (DUF485 family)
VNARKRIVFWVDKLGLGVFFAVTVSVLFRWARSATTTSGRVIAWGILIATMLFVARWTVAVLRAWRKNQKDI